MTLLAEKRKVGSSTLPLTTGFRLVYSALTSANADRALLCLPLPSDHDCPCVTVVGRSLSHVVPQCLGTRPDGCDTILLIARRFAAGALA